MKTLITLALRTPSLTVHFSVVSGLPCSYDLDTVVDAFDGSAADSGVDVLVARGGEVSAARATLRELRVQGGAGDAASPGDDGDVGADAGPAAGGAARTATAAYTVPGAGPAAGGIEFSVQYRVDGGSLSVSLVDVHETGETELVQVDLPRLVGLDDDRDGAWIAHADGGGVFSTLTDAASTSLPYGEPGDFPNLSRLPLVLLGHSRAAAGVQVLGFLSNTAVEVRRDGDGVTATAGATALHRVPGSPTAPSLPVEQPEIVRIDFLAAEDGRAPTWLDVARLAQAGIRSRRTDYFDDKFMYAVLGQLGPADRTEPSNTFEQIEELIARVSNLTDSAPQVVFVAGWNAGGHDTGYPAIETVNPVLGGEQGWQRLQQNTRTKYAANVTLDDNYDDMYDNDYTRGQFDPALLARERDGSPQTQERWNGVDLSHIAGFAKYMAPGAPGLRRADVTVERYDVRDAMLIDAMSWWSVRNDWDPAAPASAVRNLREGKFRLLEHFRQRGVQVGSEVLTYPFVDQLPFTMDGPTGSEWNGFDGTAIPAMALVYRKALIYGAAGGGDAGTPEPAKALFHNNRAAKWLDTSTPDSVITGMYFMHYLPWMALSPLDIVGFERDGSRATISLSGDSSVVVDEESGAATATLGGETILDGRSVSVPLGADRIAFYSEKDAELSYRVDVTDPGRWRVQRLSADGATPAPFRIEGGRLFVSATPFTPVVARPHD